MLFSFIHFEKPTTTNVVVQKRSSLDENSKIQILSNDLVRRLGNTDVRQKKEVSAKVVDNFCKKLLTSGYTITQSRRIAINGIRGWEKKKKNCKKRLFRTARESLSGRVWKKTVGKTSWFRKSNKRKEKKPANSDVVDNDKESTTRKSLRKEASKTSTISNRHQEEEKKKDTREEPRTAAVMFVNNTKEGLLAKNLREVVERLKHILGYKIKIVERAGTSLKQMFPLTRIGENKECGRDDCIPCTQESKGEDLPPCNKRSVLYENICIKCNPGVLEKKKNKELTPPSHPPSIYVGETSRSLFERGKEHWRDFTTNQEDSHIKKHHQIHHSGIGEPSFHLRAVGFFKSALTRQIAEAVLIQRWGEDTILNSKAEFNRSKIGRLTLGEEDKDKWEAPVIEEDDATKEWERSRTSDRRIQELRDVCQRRGVMTRSPPPGRV